MKAMRVGAITTVCVGGLLPELREFTPSTRVAFPGIPIRIYTDRKAEAAAIVASCRVDGVEIKEVSSDPVEGVSLDNVARHADYWQANPIYWKIKGLQECLEEEIARGEGVMIVDCDVTFRLGFERSFFGDVAISPFYWGRRDIMVQDGRLLQHRDGEFNAGMVISRSVDFSTWWMKAYLSGEGGFYEQGCLDMVPERFYTDYISPLHNWGKWRFSSPPPEARSYHQHLNEPSRRLDVGATRIAARRTAAEARAVLKKS